MAAGGQDGEFIRREEKLKHVDSSDLMGLERQRGKKASRIN
jgi:hypothetical protein